MNKVFLCGRLTADPEVRYANKKDGSQLAISRFSIAVDRNGKDAGADFLRCIAYERNAEFSEKYLRKGTKVIAEGRIQTGSYTDKDGKKVYTTDIVVDRFEFCEKRESSSEMAEKPKETTDEWMQVPDGVDDAGLPWS